MDKRDLLWSLYMSEREFITHHENQRTSASNILGAIAAGLVVALGTDKLSSTVEIIISILLIIMGFFGFIFCAKLYALIKLHAERSYAYLGEIDDQINGVDIAALKTKAKKRYTAKFKIFSGIPLNKIWAGFHLSILFAGVLFTGINIWKIIA